MFNYNLNLLVLNIYIKKVREKNQALLELVCKRGTKYVLLNFLISLYKIIFLYIFSDRFNVLI